MLSRRTAQIVAVVGLLVALLFVFADVIGVGQAAGKFGIRQIIGTAVGALIFIVGLVTYLRQGQT